MSLSILMSVFNEPEFQIRESVNSILAQTYQDFELIVVCDNPERDDVENILSGYSDNRIIYSKNQKNIGLALSMNKAADLAHTDMFARMDADDVAEAQRLEVEMYYMQKGYDLVFSRYLCIDENSEVIEDMEAPEYDNCDLNNKVLLDPSIIHHPTTIFKRSIFNKVGGYRNFPCSQDADLWMRMAEAGANFYYVPNILLRYRINSQSVSNKRWYKQQLTCNYIYGLSVERMYSGKDSYSTESYNRYLDKWQVNNVDAENKLRECFNLLAKASQLASKGKKLESIIYRAFVFLKSPLMREYYLMQMKKKHKLA